MAELLDRNPTPDDLARETLLRSYRGEEWQRWFAIAGAPCPTIRAPVFDSSLTMAAIDGIGVALLPARMFEHDLSTDRLVRPFEAEARTGRYWLTRLRSLAETSAMQTFQRWLVDAVRDWALC